MPDTEVLAKKIISTNKFSQGKADSAREKTSWNVLFAPGVGSDYFFFDKQSKAV